MLSRRTSVVVVVLVVLAVVVVAVAPAFASAGPAALPLHSRLVSSSPADGASVDTAEEVVLTFNEDVNPDFAQVRVTGPDGSETDGDPRVDGPTVTQALRAGLPAGSHKVTYRVVSADGHPISGSLKFTTTVSPPSIAPTQTEPPLPTGTASESATVTPSATTPTSPAPTPTVSTGPAADDADDGNGWVLWLALAALAALGAGLSWWRARRHSPTG